MKTEEGVESVKIARKSVEDFFKGVNEIPPRSKIVEGVFVTIEQYPSLELKGCIGFTSKIDLNQGVFQAAREAAFNDYRFENIRKEELNKVVFEVSVLSKRTELKNPEEIKVGVNGLIVEKEGRSGLLLPQVAVEQGWNSKQFLTHAFLKAGIDLNEKPDLYIFTAQVFREVAPNGKIVKVKLKSE